MYLYWLDIWYIEDALKYITTLHFPYDLIESV